MKNLLSTFLILLFALGLSAQSSKLSPLTRAFLSGKKLPNSTSSLLKLASSGEDSYINGYIHFNDGINKALVEEYGVTINVEFQESNIVTAKIPVTVIEQLSQLPEIDYIELAAPLYRKLDNARRLTNVNSAHNATAPLTTPYTGENVIVGVVDGGFEYAHVNFYDENGVLRVKRVWDQNSYGTPPAGYSNGVEYDTPAEIISAETDDLDGTYGHGTHVTGIAAGSDKNNGNQYYGVATSSDIVLVSLDMASDALLLESLKYIFNYADTQDKPCVINYSLGTHIGPHDGTSTFDVLADQLQGEGKIIVGAAGNEGDVRLHTSKTFTSDTDELNTFVDFTSWYNYSNISIWGEVGDTITIQIVGYDNGEEYTSAVISTHENRTVRLSNFGSSGMSGEISVVVEQRNYLNNKPNILLDISMNRLNGNDLGLKIKGTGKVHAWADGYYSAFTNNSKAGWTNGDLNSTVGEIGGVGKEMITVGAYVSDNSYAGGVTGSIASFSSLGPTGDGRIKPDITAPGSALISSIPAATRYDNGSEHITRYNNKNYYYAYMQGTSMSSPFVAGVIALWMEACPTLSPEDVRRVLAATSISDSRTGYSLPNNTWGEGKIDAYAGLLNLLTLSSLDTDIKQDLLVAFPNPTDDEVNIGFVKSDKNVTLDIFNVAGQKLRTDNIGNISAGTNQVCSLGELGSGVYIVNVNGETINQSFRVVVK